MRTALILATIVAFSLAPLASAQSGAEEQADRRLYNQLTAKLRQIDRDYERTLEKAMGQARSGDGRADLELQAQLLSLREARDRTMSRLLLISARHDWSMPDFDEEATGEDERGQASPAEQVFAPAARIIRQRFEAEALEIARAVRLPVISMPTWGGPAE